jgi:hypothetical protein
LITPVAIARHAQKYLPMASNLFSSPIAISSISVSIAGVVTVNSTAHGLTTGDEIVVIDAKTENSITGRVNNVDGTVDLTMQYAHDLTTPKQPKDQQTLYVTGTGISGDKQIVNVLDANRVIIDSAPITLTGDELLIERRWGIRGIKPVTVITPNQFTFMVPAGLPPSLRDANIIKTAKIGVVESVERAEKIYTKMSDNKPFAFVIMQDGNVEKDRNTKGDAVATPSRQDARRAKIITGFSIVVFFKTDTEIAAEATQEIAYGEMLLAMLKTFYGAALGSGNHLVALNSHGAGVYTTAYYSHVYEFQIVDDITFENGWLDEETCAFKNIHLDLLNGTEHMTTSGALKR